MKYLFLLLAVVMFSSCSQGDSAKIVESTKIRLYKVNYPKMGVTDIVKSREPMGTTFLYTRGDTVLVNTKTSMIAVIDNAEKGIITEYIK